MIDISVIIPTWNRANMIERAIRSALEQTVTNLEVLVCDDGSTDETESIVKAISDSRVRWISGPRGGRPAIPRNRGIKKAQGEWLAFLDSDDYWLPEKVEKQIRLLEASHLKACSTNAYRLIPGKDIQGLLLQYGSDLITFNILLQYNPVICSSIIINRSLVNTIQGFPEVPGICEDYALWLRVASLTEIAYLDEPLVVYHDDPTSSVRSTVTNDFMIQQRDVLHDYLSWIKSQEDIKLRYIKTAGGLYRSLLWKIFKKKYLHLG